MKRYTRNGFIDRLVKGVPGDDFSVFTVNDVTAVLIENPVIHVTESSRYSDYQYTMRWADDGDVYYELYLSRGSSFDRVDGIMADTISSAIRQAVGIATDEDVICQL